MKVSRIKAFFGSCCCLVLAFSVSANAALVDQMDSGISIESWLLEGGRELPVLSFDQIPTHEELANDIQVENVIQEEAGNVRFQLSHSGPMSRQVFANVRRVEQDDGYTRSIITNIADGQQTEYLTRTSEVAPVSKKGKGSAVGLLAESGFVDDQYVECPWCYVVAIIVSEAWCAFNTNMVFMQCRKTCESQGGVKTLKTGICGTGWAECICRHPPREAKRF